MEKYLIHSNELHLIDAEKIHQAVEKMVESPIWPQGQPLISTFIWWWKTILRIWRKEERSTMCWG